MAGMIKRRTRFLRRRTRCFRKGHLWMRQDVTPQGEVVLIEERCKRCGRVHVVEERPSRVGANIHT